MRPKIVCLCGSTRFKKEFIEANFKETMKGNIVLSVGWFAHADGASYMPDSIEKRRLDWLHFEKIKLADEVLILDVGGYIGRSTCDEIGCAIAWEKTIRYWREESDPKI